MLEQWPLLTSLLLLILVANGAPVIAHYLLPSFAACPLDGGRCFADGRPWLGPSKTVRGLLASLLLTTLAAPLLGLPVSTGILIAVGAMLGDLLSSFVKRRLAITPSGMALGIDQIPESLIPLLFVQSQFGLGVAAVIAIVAAFFLLELLLSRLLYRLHIRQQPW